MSRRAVELLVVCVLLSSAGVGATGEYRLTIDQSYDTPTETVTVEGEKFTVTAVGVVDHGDKLTVRVNAPDEEYQINLYTLDQRVQDFRPADGNETVQFDTSLVEPGSYVIAAVDNQEFYAVHPVVISDYEVSVSLPEQIPAGEPFDARVTITPSPGETPPGSIELAVWNEQIRERVRLTRVEEGVYETTMPPLANGTYSVSGAVIAEERIDGEENVLAVSKPTTLVADDVLEKPVGGPDTTPGNNTTDDGGETPADDSEPDDEDDVISPNDTADDDATGPGFGIVVGVAAVLLGALVARRRLR